MSKINFPKKQEQRLIPKYLLEYSEELVKNHPDPTAEWGGGSGGSPIEAGEGIIITGTDTKTISVDAEDVALVKNLATVAFSGSYNDLSGKPDLSVYELKSDAFTGDYNDLTNKPTIPTVNDPTITFTQGGATKGTITLNQSSNQTIALDAGGSAPTNMVTTNTQQTISGNKTFTGALSSYQAGASWMRLNIEPNALIYEDSTSNSNTTTLAFQPNEEGYDVRIAVPSETGTLALKSDIITSYNDLTDKPTIPTVGNGTITIKKNNTTVDTFTTNQSTNKSINITVPTKTSDLTNDDGFIAGITSSDVTTALGYTPGTSNFSGSYNDLTGKPDLSVYELAADAFSGDYADLTNKPDLSIYELAANAFSGNYNDLTNKPTFATVATTGAYNDLSGKPDLSVYELAADAFSGDYNDLTNKPTIPAAVSGTNDGTNWTTLTIGSDTYNIPAGGGSSYSAGTGIDITNNTISIDNTVALKTDIPSNYVTTNTAQTITGKKTFTTNPIDIVYNQKGIQLHSGTNNSTNSKLGFTLYNSIAGSLNNEIGFLESNTASNNGHSTLLGYYNTSHDTAYSNWDLGFAYNGYNATQSRTVAYKLVVPNQYNLNNFSTKRYIPIDFTNGTNTVRASANGIVDISTLLPTVPTPTVLYNVPNGEAGVNPITMSDSFANYQYVDIQYRCYDNANQVKSVRIYDPNGKEVYVDWEVLTNNTNVYAKKSIYILSGNTMTVKTNSDRQVYYSNGSNMGVQATAEADYQHQIKITKVVGWKDSRLS